MIPFLWGGREEKKLYKAFPLLNHFLLLAECTNYSKYLTPEMKLKSSLKFEWN